MSDEEPPSPIGEVVGNYKILRALSTGGMGTVYYAEHTLIGRSAAVKVLHPELSGSKDIVNRFFREAKATTSIKHPGIVEVFDYGFLPSGDGYIIMEFLEGMSLAQRLDNGRSYSEGDAAMLMRGVCSALAAAHGKGIVHRDLKPDNIFLVDDPEAPIGERPKVLDFGIAKLTDIGLAGDGTKTGFVMGTPTYMSPEQCRGTGDLDHRADLYSLGCILYELVTGRPPFKELGAGELIGAHQHLEPDPPTTHNPAVSREMDALILRLLDKKPANRVQSAAELSQALARIATKHGYHISMVTPAPFRTITPMPAPAPEPEPADKTTTDPTTLTHSAAQSIVRPPAPSRRFAVWKLALAAGVVAAGAIGFVAFRAATTADDDPKPATTPTPVVQPTPPAPTPPPPPPARAPEPSKPEPEPAPVIAKPEPAKPSAKPEPANVAAKPEPAKPVAKPKPKPKPKPKVEEPKKPPSIGPIETEL